MTIYLRGLVGSLLLLGAGPLFAAPACHMPRGIVAQTICGSPEYRAMDLEIEALTARAKARLSHGELSQLAESTARYMRQRNGCAWAAHNSAHPGTAIDECVHTSLEARVRRLRDVVDRSGSEVTAR